MSPIGWFEFLSPLVIVLISWIPVCGFHIILYGSHIILYGRSLWGNEIRAEGETYFPDIWIIWIHKRSNRMILFYKSNKKIVFPSFFYGFCCAPHIFQFDKVFLPCTYQFLMFAAKFILIQFFIRFVI